MKHKLLLVILVAGVVCAQAFGIETDSKSQSGIALINLGEMQTTDGKELVVRLLEKAQALNDYSYDCDLVSWRTGKPRQSGAHFLFKKPNMVRIEVVSHDFRNGSVIVRGADGAIKGVGGGMLHVMQMSLDENSRMLKLPSGRTVLESDFLSLIQNVKRILANGGVCKATKEAFAASTLHGSDSVVILDVYKKGANGDELTDRVLVNPNTMLPVEWASFVNGQIICTVAFKNLVANKGVVDSTFKL